MKHLYQANKNVLYQNLEVHYFDKNFGHKNHGEKRSRKDIFEIATRIEGFQKKILGYAGINETLS